MRRKRRTFTPTFMLKVATEAVAARGGAGMVKDVLEKYDLDSSVVTRWVQQLEAKEGWAASVTPIVETKALVPVKSERTEGAMSNPQFRALILRDARKIGVAAAAKQHGVTTSMIYYWKAKVSTGPRRGRPPRETEPIIPDGLLQANAEVLGTSKTEAINDALWALVNALRA